MGEIVSLTLGEAVTARRIVWFEAKSVYKVDVAGSALAVMDFLMVSFLGFFFFFGRERNGREVRCLAIMWSLLHCGVLSFAGEYQWNSCKDEKRDDYALKVFAWEKKEKKERKRADETQALNVWRRVSEKNVSFVLESFFITSIWPLSCGLRAGLARWKNWPESGAKQCVKYFKLKILTVLAWKEC